MSISSRGASTGWARGGSTSGGGIGVSGGGGVGGNAVGMVRRSHSTSGAQWNVQVVKSKVNGKCLWNACKALSLGLLLMLLGATMATVGYYADQLSLDSVIRGNHTVIVKNESRGFHLNNLSYAGPIVMGVGGFIIVAACVMTFEARDSAAKVVPARLKMSAGAPSNLGYSHNISVLRSGHGSMRASVVQPACGVISTNYHGHGSTTHHGDHYRHHSSFHHHLHHPNDRHNLTQSFVQFSRGLALESKSFRNVKFPQSASPSGTRSNSLKVPQQSSINRSPSAPDLGTEKQPEITENIQATPPPKSIKTDHQSSRKTFATCALLNPGLLYRHALSVDEASANYRSNDSLQHGTSAGSQGSMAMDLHYESVTLKIRDKRRNPLKRQRKFDEEIEHQFNNSRRNSHSHSCSPRLTNHHHMKDSSNNNNGQHMPFSSKRRSSNASDCTHRSRTRKRNSICHSTNRGKLERAISSDSRLTRAIPQCYHSYEPTRNNSAEQDNPVISTSDSDIRKSHQVMVHFSSPPNNEE